MPASRSDLVALIENPVPFLRHDDSDLRRMAVTALTRDQARGSLAELEALGRGPEPAIRVAVTEKIGECGDATTGLLDELRTDPEPSVREAVATAYGEIGDGAALPWLIEAAFGDPDRQVREASVASLGAIGDPRAVDPLLELVSSGPPQVRRRAIAAITVFDDDRIEPVLRRAALERNPGVREAAEMVVGRQLREASDP